MTVTASQVREAIKLISDDDKFSPRELAVDAKGRAVDPTSDKACRWCGIGAIRKVANMDEHTLTDLPSNDIVVILRASWTGRAAVVEAMARVAARL